MLLETVASVEKYAVHAHGAAGEGTFFAMDFGVRGRVGPRAPGPGQKRDGYFSRWPSPVSRRSARWEDRFHSGLNPVIYPRCRKPCNNAFTDEPATTATVTARRGAAAVYGHLVVVFPSVFLCPLYDFYFLSVSFLSPFSFVSLPAFLGFRPLGGAHAANDAGAYRVGEIYPENRTSSSRILYRRVVKTSEWKCNRSRV